MTVFKKLLDKIERKKKKKKFLHIPALQYQTKTTQSQRQQPTRQPLHRSQ